MEPGLLIAIIVGSSMGVLGGIVGTIIGIRNTRGPKERAFAIRFSILLWIGITSFLALEWFLPVMWRGLLGIPYGILLPVVIRYGNKLQERFQNEDAVLK